MEIIEKVKSILEQAIEGAEVHILDPRNDGVHLEAYVIAKQFDGLSLVEQHRLVMEPLKASFATDLHALALRTMTPEKWNQSPLKEKIT